MLAEKREDNEMLRNLSEAVQGTTKYLKRVLKLNTKLWTTRFASLIYAEDDAPQGPPSITTTGPCYSAFINLGCCLENMLTIAEQKEDCRVEDALEFIQFPTGNLQTSKVLRSRPEVESWLYMVGVVF